MYHGIIIDKEFKNKIYSEKFKIFAKRKSADNDWVLYGVEIFSKKIGSIIIDMQANMKSDEPYYAHFYNDDELIVVFKEKIFKVRSHISTWASIIEFGKKLNISEEQLDFWPNRFQDEIHYFKKEDFV